MATARQPAAKAPSAKTSVKSAGVKPAAKAPAKAPAKKPAARPATPVPASAPKAEKKAKPEKVKVVRDSFTIPKSEDAAIAELKKRALAQGSEVKKSELLRAGLMLLAACGETAFAKALAQVPALKTGRPGKA